MIAKCVLVGDWVGRDTDVGEEIYEIHDWLIDWLIVAGGQNTQTQWWMLKLGLFKKSKEPRKCKNKWTKKKNRQGTYLCCLEMPRHASPLGGRKEEKKKHPPLELAPTRHLLSLSISLFLFSPYTKDKEK